MASVRAMSTNANTGKGWYITYSEGTAAMLVTLTKYESELSNYLNKVIMMAPCTGPFKDGDDPDVLKASQEEIGYMRGIGVYALYGPNWQTDLETICAADALRCEGYKIDTGVAAPYSTKNLDHWTQNSLAKNFQPFNYDWAYPDTIKVDSYPLSDITTIPISLYIGEADKTCAAERGYDLAQ